MRRKEAPVDVAALDDDLRWKLGIRPGHKVCLFHVRKYLLPLFIKSDLRLMLDWAEEGCDVVLYWLQPQDNVEDIMPRLAQQIKKNGRIWLIVPKKEIAVKQGFKQSWQEIQRTVLDATNLVDNKTLSIGDGEYGTQFVFRKTAREEAKL